MTARNPAPWSFRQHHLNSANVIVDGDNRVLVTCVPANCGPLMAAAPRLLRALTHIADIAPAESAVRMIAERAIEEFTEREGMALADWQTNRPAPRLRVIGVAT